MSQIRVRAHNYKNKITVPGNTVKLRANVVDAQPGKVAPVAKPIEVPVDTSVQWTRKVDTKRNVTSPPTKSQQMGGGKPSQIFKQPTHTVSHQRQIEAPVMMRRQPSTASHHQKPIQRTQVQSEDEDDEESLNSDDLEALQQFADENGDELEDGEEYEEGEEGEDDDEEDSAPVKQKVGPSALECTPESLTKTPKNSGWHMIVDPDKYHSKPLPSTRQSQIKLPEDEEEEEEEEFEEDEFEEGEEGEGEEEMQPQPMGKKTPKSVRQPPQSRGDDPEFKDKVADLAELYSLHRMGFEPNTAPYDLNTDSKLITDSIKRGTKDLMKSETVVLGQAMICMAGSGIERGTQYANNWLAHRGSLNRLPDCRGFSWFLDSPDIKGRFEEPLKRIHEIYGSKIREINPFWSLGMIFLGTLFQYADAKKNMGEQQQQIVSSMQQPPVNQQMQMQQQYAMQQQQMMQQQQQQMMQQQPTPNQQQLAQMQQQMMMQQQQMRAQQQQMPQQHHQQMPSNPQLITQPQSNSADDERKLKLLRLREQAMKNKAQAQMAEQKKTTLVEQVSSQSNQSLPQNKVTENLRIVENQFDPDIDAVVNMMKTMNPLERRRFSLQIQNGQAPQAQPSRPSIMHTKPVKPPVITRGVKFNVPQEEDEDEDEYTSEEEDEYESDDSEESLPQWNPTTPKKPTSAKKGKIDIGVTPVRTPPF